MPRFKCSTSHFPRQSLAAVSLVVAVTFAWSGAASATRAPTAPMRPAPATALVTPTARQVAGVIAPAASGDSLSAIQASLMSRYPTSFGGIYINKAGQLVVATAGSRNSALQQAAKAGFAATAQARSTTDRPILPIQVSFVNTGASLQHLYDLKAAILDNPALVADGVDGAGLDIEHGRVVVMSRTALGASAVEADYGAAVKVLVDSGSGLFADRFADTPAFNAGDQIVTPSDGETTCTSGFGMQDTSTGQTYLLTAGHCGTATWYSTRSSNPVYDGGTLIGTTMPGSDFTSVIDSQLISTDASCISWGGTSSKPSNDERIYITGYANPPQGAEIETEGSVSLSQTGTVSYYDVSKVIGGESLQDLDLVTAVGINGDSGGPMIYPTIYGPLAGGTDVGWYESGSQGWGVFQLIGSEMFTYALLTGDGITPVTSSNGTSC